jgi:transcriptional regulator with GAF, ATPase, and Fis domain
MTSGNYPISRPSTERPSHLTENPPNTPVSPLEKFQSLLLNAWREACRHIELDESTATIARMVAQSMPLETLLIRRFDNELRAVETLAAGQVSERPFHAPPRTTATPAKWTRLMHWAGQDKLVHCPAIRRSGEVNLLLPDEVEGEVIAGVLANREGPIGALVLVAEYSRAFQPEHLELARLLLEPFSVAMENHRRLHELSSLREAAESERLQLLKRLGQKESNEETIVGADSGLKMVMERVNLVATSNAPVLILGETGTGKEVVSRAIHHRSSRTNGPFIRVNCGAIPPELIDSQLFGHERGSFTGADDARQGWFERADGGTLFLDEIGELPLQAQVRLLRVLQDGFIERVGGQHPVRVDVRIVAATHRDLASMVKARTFREDLWYRVNVFPVLMPPLRDRVEDIGPLARHFALRAAKRFGLAFVEPSEADFKQLESYNWPGNIRELAAVVDRSVILGGGTRLEVAKALGISRDSTITRDDSPTFYEVLPDHSSPQDERNSNSLTHALPTKPNAVTKSLDDAIRDHIVSALKETSGRIEGKYGAAIRLGINPHTLRAKMRKLKIEWSRFRDEP